MNFTERNEPLITLTTQNNLELSFLSEKALEGINRRLERNKENNFGFGCYPIDLDNPTNTLTARYGNFGTDQLLFYSGSRKQHQHFHTCY